MADLQAFEQYILDITQQIDTTGRTTEAYRKIFSKLTVTQKHKLVKDLENGQTNLFIIDTPLTKSTISFANNVKVAKKNFNYDFYKSITYPARGDAPGFTTADKHLVLELPIRRQAQLLLEKISVSGGKQNIDFLTGAPSSTAKTSRFSFPELQLMLAHGSDKAVKELYTIRGGDINGYRSFENSLMSTGQVSLEAIEGYRSGVTSKTTASNYLRAAHLRHNLDE